MIELSTGLRLSGGADRTKDTRGERGRPCRDDLERRHRPADGPPRADRAGRGDIGPADIAGTLCGAHAQVLSAARSCRSAGAIAGATRSDVQRALWQDRTLVKTFGPRGTVHLLSTADLPMWTGALSALPASVPMHPEPVRFTPDQADEVIAAIGDALADAELTVDELTEAIVERTGPWAGRADDGRVPGQVAALAPADEHGRASRRALLRTQPRAQR